MCFMTGIITAKTDYIIKTKNALVNLKEFENDFRYEAIIINHIKCALMKKEDIDRLLRLRLIDDDFFTKVFDDLPPHTRDFSRE